MKGVWKDEVRSAPARLEAVSHKATHRVTANEQLMQHYPEAAMHDVSNIHLRATTEGLG